MSNQTFPVIYKNTRFTVDPKLLYDSSLKFRQVYQPYANSNHGPLQLVISSNLPFTERNMGNFLKLCQNQATDVQNSEMKEICEIARMFQAEKIYNTGASFVQNNIDPNFNVPVNKYDDSNGQRYLIIEDSNEQSETFSSQSSREVSNASKDDTTAQPLQIDQEPEPEIPEGSVVYQIRINCPAFKCNRFSFSKDNQIILSAKQKGAKFVIGTGSQVHIKKDTSNQVATMVQSTDCYNTVQAEGQQFVIRYVTDGKMGHYAIEVNFIYKGNEMIWTPEETFAHMKKHDRSPDVTGEYDREPIHSKKNLVLRNPEGNVTFIVRKMDLGFYEAECNKDLPPTFAFAIAISEIVGPYFKLGEQHIL